MHLRLEPHRPRSFGRFGVKAVFDHPRSSFFCHPFGLELSRIEILTVQSHLGSESTHPLEFEGVGSFGGIHIKLKPRLRAA